MDSIKTGSMIRLAISIYVLLLPVLSSFAQAESWQRCGYEVALSKMEESNPGYLQAVNRTFESVKTLAQNQRSRDETLCIPVVFHVVYNQTEGNIPDSVLLSQLEVLNEDYNRSNPDTNLTRSEFDSLAGSAGIQFYMATEDPDGNPTNGITRTQTSTPTFGISFDDVKSDATGGKDPWHTNKYLNIWICDLSFFGFPAILGVAYPPAGAPNWPPGTVPADTNLQGVVAHYAVVGRNNPLATGPFALTSSGRTMTHEVGHYLGLRHTWGDAQGMPGCSVDDGIADTPNCESAQQQTCNYGSNTCVDTPYDYPDMIENFMDYSDEACQNMFTHGQITIMRLMLETERSGLLIANCDTSTTDTSNVSGIVIDHSDKGRMEIWPNPVKDEFSFVPTISNGTWELVNMMGSVVQTGTINSSIGKKVQVMHLPPGSYLLRCSNSTEQEFGQIVKLH